MPEPSPQAPRDFSQAAKLVIDIATGQVVPARRRQTHYPFLSTERTSNYSAASPRAAYRSKRSSA